MKLSKKIEKTVEKSDFLKQFRHLKEYLTVAGIKSKPKQIFIILFSITGLIDFSFLAYLIFLIIVNQLKFAYILVVSFFMLTLGVFLTFMIIWLLFLIMIDYLKFKRRTELEEILPEFLRLVSANHRSGLPLDMSLWKANRPRFGILSEEINDVAKKTYASGNLMKPLQEFSLKYDSNLLKRVISNILEGMKTGADLSGLLDDVSTNITTIKNTRKELASEVENYMLFISVTVLVIAPLMFSLTQKMSGLIETVRDTLAESMTAGETGPAMPIQIEAVESERKFEYYFDIFVYLMLFTNSTMSVLLMSMVKYGNVKRDMKRIPGFFLFSLGVYVFCKFMFPL